VRDPAELFGITDQAIDELFAGTYRGEHASDLEAFLRGARSALEYPPVDLLARRQIAAAAAVAQQLALENGHRATAGLRRGKVAQSSPSLRSSRGRLRSRAAAAAVAAIVGTSSMAVAGVLPRPIQAAVARVARHFGIELKNPEEATRPQPAGDKGELEGPLPGPTAPQNDSVLGDHMEGSVNSKKPETASGDEGRRAHGRPGKDNDNGSPEDPGQGKGNGSPEVPGNGSPEVPGNGSPEVPGNGSPEVPGNGPPEDPGNGPPEDPGQGKGNGPPEDPGQGKGNGPPEDPGQGKGKRPGDPGRDIGERL
jgi:hypothetical protein